MALLNRGDKLTALYSQHPCTVENLLGAGTQGEVYRVGFSGGAYALKWYRPEYLRVDPTLRARLEKAIHAGSPGSAFLWPFELVTGSKQALGYLMALREPRFVEIQDFLKNPTKATFAALAITGFQLSDNFLRLHAKGLCYKDVNFGNITLDPEDGEIRIGDNDNVDINNGPPGAIAGTPGFMAPEVFRGESPPSRQSDLFSLAVLLFFLFMLHHPLRGKREVELGFLTMDNLRRLFATDPLFIFDPDDRSNAPLPEAHGNALAYWPLYPQFLRDLFIRSFTSGLHDPVNGRVQEGEWRSAMCRLRDAVFPCPHCGGENFYDPVQAATGALAACWACGQVPPFPARLRLGSDVVMLNRGSRLFVHHLEGRSTYDFSRPMAEVTDEPRMLRNLSTRKWVARTADRHIYEVAPGQQIALVSGLSIDFGKIEAQIRC
jgi:eukaryotic-like serine/threonine-protein kinase